MSFQKGKRVLVTGGAGFIGSNLAERLVQEGAQVRLVDNLDYRILQQSEVYRNDTEKVRVQGGDTH